ncbi:MAG: extracellular solute-binding protein, partial [Treponema sp.]|nr:extracellular solute-binding protein [Treponema sp.]
GLFDKAGVPYPTEKWTWQDMADAAKKLTVKDASGKIIQYGFQYDEYCRLWISHFQSNGGQAFDNRDKPTKVTFNNDLGVASAQYLFDLVQSLNVSPPPGVAGVLGHRDSFANGIVAMILDGSWMNTQFAQKEGMKYGVALVPLGKVARGGWIAPTHYAMSGKTKYPDQVWTYLKWWFSYDNSMSFSGYGDAIKSAGMPVWKSAYTDPKFKPDEQVSMIAKQVTYSVPDMTFQYFGTWYWDTLNVGLQEMVGNKIAPKTAIETIAQRTQKNVLDEIGK